MIVIYWTGADMLKKKEFPMKETPVMEFEKH